VVGYIDLVGAPDAAKVAAPVARGVDENGAAPGPAASPQAGTGSVVDHRRQPDLPGSATDDVRAAARELVRIPKDL
jgi:hypothetical protein